MGEKYKVEPSVFAGQWSVLTPLHNLSFDKKLAAEEFAEHLNAAHDHARATAEAELAALRAKWEALRGECEAWREAEGWMEWDSGESDIRVMKALQAKLSQARTLTDSTHALEAE